MGRSEVMRDQQIELGSKTFDDYALPYHWLLKREDIFGYGTEYWGYINIILDLLRCIKPKKVLDVGCGDGLIAETIAEQIGSEVIGIDISFRAIKFAELMSRKAKYEQIYLEDLARRGNKFDCAAVVEVLEHIHPNHCAPFLLNLLKLLDESGYLILSVPSTKHHRLRDDHFQHFSTEQITSLLSQTGFEILQILFQHHIGYGHFCQFLRTIIVNNIIDFTFLKRILVKMYFCKYNLLNSSEKAGRLIILASSGKKV